MRNQAHADACRRIQMHASRSLDVIKGHSVVIRGLHGTNPHQSGVLLTATRVEMANDSGPSC